MSEITKIIIIAAVALATALVLRIKSLEEQLEEQEKDLRYTKLLLKKATEQIQKMYERH